MVFRFFEREQECGVRAATIFEIGERERGNSIKWDLDELQAE
jgi:hypothetical protein